jgi:nicotinate-nucleotide adenylyltransferase
MSNITCSLWSSILSAEPFDSPAGANPYGDLPYARPQRLAVFGGSFDPIHNGHLQLASRIIELGHADEILFVPAFRPPHKAEMTLSPALDRLNMLRLALEPFVDFSYSDIELQRAEEFSYTYDTLSIFRKLYPDCELFFIMGMDSLRHLPEWHRASELVQHFKFIVYPRPEVLPPAYTSLAQAFGERNALKLLGSVLSGDELLLSDLSSSAIRAGCARGEDQAHALPAAVWKYIVEQRLYQQIESSQ